MSARRLGDGGDGRSGGARTVGTALALVLVAVAMMLLLRAKPAADPFDPRSGAATGTRGLVVLLQRQGASVEVADAAPAPGSDHRVLVLQDRLNDDQRAGLRRFAEAGGVVVMADPGSSLAGPPSVARSVTEATPRRRDLQTEIDIQRGDCDVAALTHLRGLFVRDGVLFERTDGQPHCFGSGASFVVVQPLGKGVVVQLGDNELFTNRLLRYADNGGLATALLAPADGAHVSILIGREPVLSSATIGGDDETTLSDLVRPGVWMAFAQLAIAFLVFAAARAIRPGRPVREPAQVPIAGSELVVATGNLMQRARHAQRAGSLLRFDAHRTLCERFRLPATATVEALDAAVAARADVAPGRVTELLGREVSDAAGLLQLSNDLHSLRRQTERQTELEGANQ